MVNGYILWWVGGGVFDFVCVFCFELCFLLMLWWFSLVFWIDEMIVCVVYVLLVEGLGYVKVDCIFMGFDFFFVNNEVWK